MRETLFDKLDFVSIPYTKEQQWFKNLAIFDVESICVREDQFKDTETTQWIGKHVLISVSISSNLIETPKFHGNSNPRNLVESFFVALERLSARSKAQMKLQFSDIETSIKSSHNTMFAVLTERRSPRETVLDLKKNVLRKMKKMLLLSSCKHKRINSLTCKNTCYQSLASIAPNTTLTS